MMWLNGRLTSCRERKDINLQSLCCVDEVQGVRKVEKGLKYIWEKEKRMTVSWPVNSKLQGYEADVKDWNVWCVCVSETERPYQYCQAWRLGQCSSPSWRQCYRTEALRTPPSTWLQTQQLQWDITVATHDCVQASWKILGNCMMAKKIKNPVHSLINLITSYINIVQPIGT